MPENPIHLWFNLTYSSYLVLPRSVLQSAPQAWQAKLVDLLEELESMYPGDIPERGNYHVKVRDGKHFIKDDLADYERGRRHVELKPHPSYPPASDDGRATVQASDPAPVKPSNNWGLKSSKAHRHSPGLRGVMSAK